MNKKKFILVPVASDTGVIFEKVWTNTPDDDARVSSKENFTRVLVGEVDNGRVVIKSAYKCGQPYWI